MNYDAFWQEVGDVIKEADEINQKPHEKTIRALHKEYGMTERDLQVLMNSLVRDGKMGTRKAKSCNGKMVTVYFPLED